MGTNISNGGGVDCLVMTRNCMSVPFPSVAVGPPDGGATYQVSASVVRSQWGYQPIQSHDVQRVAAALGAPGRSMGARAMAMVAFGWLG
jgi:hypothetical protein